MSSRDLFTSSLKIFSVLDVLCRNFATGFTNKEVAEACEINATTALRCLNTLIEAGYAEKIIESDKYRPSHKFAQKSAFILKSLNSAVARHEESIQRINTEI